MRHLSDSSIFNDLCCDYNSSDLLFINQTLDKFKSNQFFKQTKHLWKPFMKTIFENHFSKPFFKTIFQIKAYFFDNSLSDSVIQLCLKLIWKSKFNQNFFQLNRYLNLFFVKNRENKCFLKNKKTLFILISNLFNWWQLSSRDNNRGGD